MSPENSPPDTAAGPETGPTPPVLRIVSPNPTDEEVAALVAVVASLGTVAPTPQPARNWARPERGHRRPLTTGRGAWHASALPR